MTTLDAFPVSGSVAEGFEPVRAAFEKNFAKHGEVGAAVHMTLDGQPVVDLWDATVNPAWAARSGLPTRRNVWRLDM